MQAAVENEVFFDPKTAPVKITVQNLSVVYKATDETKQTIALQGVNLDIKRGETFLLSVRQAAEKQLCLELFQDLFRRQQAMFSLAVLHRKKPASQRNSALYSKVLS